MRTTTPAGRRAVRYLLEFVGSVALQFPRFEVRNRCLFTYRPGTEAGTRLLRAMEELRDWLAARPGARVQIVPVREITWSDGATERRTVPL